MCCIQYNNKTQSGMLVQHPQIINHLTRDMTASWIIHTRNTIYTLEMWSYRGLQYGPIFSCWEKRKLPKVRIQSINDARGIVSPITYLSNCIHTCRNIAQFVVWTNISSFDTWKSANSQDDKNPRTQTRWKQLWKVLLHTHSQPATP